MRSNAYCGNLLWQSCLTLQALVEDEKLPRTSDDKPATPAFTVTPLDWFGNRGRSLSAT